MLIGIDGNEANMEVRVGIGEYAYQLLIQFAKQASEQMQFRIYLKSNPLGNMPRQTQFWKYQVVWPPRLWTQFGLPINLFTKRQRPDVFFTPSHYAPRFSHIPRAISVMDVSYFHFPELFNKDDLYQLRNWTKYSAQKATKVFTISESSKNDIINYYKVEPKNVIVTYPGIKTDDSLVAKQNMEELVRKYNITNTYFLYVGTIQPRKNILKLIEAFDEVLKNKKGINNTDIEKLQLILVGKKGWQYKQILEAPKALGIEHKVKFLDFVADEELVALYKHAICYVLPSLYEGFGLPVLEAMKYDCPVITSNVSSLPEAGGEAALYVNPNDSHDIAMKMQSLLENDNLRKQMILKGREQIKKFSWEKTAKQTLEVLQSIIKA